MFRPNVATLIRREFERAHFNTRAKPVAEVRQGERRTVSIRRLFIFYIFFIYINTTAHVLVTQEVILDIK